MGWALNGDGPLRVGVIGVGRIGRLHAELLARRVPGVALAAVHDPVAGVAEPVAAALGVPALATVEELLAAPGVDAVAICSSTDSHAPLMVAAARAGKAIFCEKPISLDLAELDRALAAVQAAGVPLQIGFNRRFDPSHRAVRDAVAAGTVGDPHILRITSRDPEPPPLAYVRISGGLFLDMTIHDFDMARYITGSEVVEVFARGALRIEPAFAEAGDVDTAVVTLTHANGCLTTIDNSRQATYGYDQRIEVLGSKGSVAAENMREANIEIANAQGFTRPPLLNFFMTRYIAAYANEIAGFIRAVNDGGATPTTGEDGLKALALADAAIRSVEEGRAVKVSEILG